MTSIFQALMDFLNFLLSPIWTLLEWMKNTIFYAISVIAFYLLSLIVSFINGVIYGICYIFDKILIGFVSFIGLICGQDSNGVLGWVMGSSPIKSIAGNLISYGSVGVSWISNFINVGNIFAPFVTYLTFLICWTSYKIIKSWIPGIGR